MRIATASLLRSFASAAALTFMASAAAQDAVENSPAESEDSPPVVHIQQQNFRSSSWNLSGEVTQNYISFANGQTEGSYFPDSSLSLRLTSPSEHFYVRAGTDLNARVFPGVETQRSHHFTLGYENGRHGFEAGLLPREYTLDMVLNDPHAPAAIRSVLSGETHRDILGARFRTGFAFGANDNWSMTFYGMGGRSQERKRNDVRDGWGFMYDTDAPLPKLLRIEAIEALDEYLATELLPQLDALKAEAIARSGELFTLEDAQAFGAEAREFLQRARESLGSDFPYLEHIDRALAGLEESAIESFHARYDTDTGPVIERLHASLVPLVTEGIESLKTGIAELSDERIWDNLNAIMYASSPSSQLHSDLSAIISRISDSGPVVTIEDAGGSETLCADFDISEPAQGFLTRLADYGVDTGRLESRLDEVGGTLEPVCIDLPMPSYSLRYEPEMHIDAEGVQDYAAQIDALVRRPVSGSEVTAAVFGINKEAGQPIGVPVFQNVKQFLKEGEAYNHIWTLQARLQYMTERADFHLNLGWTETQGWEGDGKQRIAGLGIGGGYKFLRNRQLEVYGEFKAAAFENYHGMYNRWKEDADEREIPYGFAAAYMGAEYTLRQRWPVGVSFGASCEAMMACAGHAEASAGYNARNFNIRAFYGMSKPVSDRALEALDRGRFSSVFWEETRFIGVDFTYRMP